MHMQQSQQTLSEWQKTTLAKPEFRFISQLQSELPDARIYLVGGAVRDLIIGRATDDYDFVIGGVEANELEKFLAQHGTVNLVGKSFGIFKFAPEGISGSDAIDIALPRTEFAGMSGGYRDFEVQSDKNLPIELDLGRRDFTINAMAWDIINQTLIDPFDGLADIEQKMIRAIGEPEIRFQEDYTRMLRAIRFACQLDFVIEQNTFTVIYDKSEAISTIATERVTEEFTKIIMSPHAEFGIRLLEQSQMLRVIIPELSEAIGVGQNKAHIYDVFEHLVRSLGVAAKNNYPLSVRLAALFHDIGKPATKEGDGKESTFYNHDQVGAKMTKKILERLQYPNDTIKYVVHLVRYHMFYYALDTVSDAGIRRLLTRLGKDNVEDFINLRICDRLGMGRPKAKPWKLLQLEQRLKEVQLDPITPKMLKIDGLRVMELLSITPGPKIGLILNALLGDVLEHPEHNTVEYLEARVAELNALPDDELKKMHPDIAYYEEEQKRLLHTND